jgi:glycosyltransferase involved in cell wall biosynthesis
VGPDATSVRGALARFLAEPEWAAAQRESLAARIDAAFSWRAVGPAYLDLYRSVASAHGRVG